MTDKYIDNVEKFCIRGALGCAVFSIIFVFSVMLYFLLTNFFEIVQMLSSIVIIAICAYAVGTVIDVLYM